MNGLPRAESAPPPPPPPPPPVAAKLRVDDESRQRQELVRRNDGDVAAIGDPARALEHIHAAAKEWACRRRERDAGSGANPDGEVPNVVAGKFVGLELDRSRDPAALGRGGVDYDLVVRSRSAACERPASERDAIRRGVFAQQPGDDRSPRRPAFRARSGGNDGAIRGGGPACERHQHLNVPDIDALTPGRTLAVRQEGDLARIETSGSHRDGRPRERASQVAAPSEWLHTVELLAKRRGAPAAQPSVRGHEPQPITRRGLAEDVAGSAAKLLDEGAAVDDSRRAERVVEHDRQRGWAVTCAGPARDRSRGGGRDENDDRDPKEHEENIAEAERSTVLLLRARQVARRRKLDARADASPQQMDQQRNDGGSAKKQIERCEEAHRARARVTAMPAAPRTHGGEAPRRENR